MLQEVDGNIQIDRNKLVRELYYKKLLIKSFDGWQRASQDKVKRFHKRQIINFENQFQQT